MKIGHRKRPEFTLVLIFSPKEKELPLPLGEDRGWGFFDFCSHY